MHEDRLADLIGALFLLLTSSTSLAGQPPEVGSARSTDPAAVEQVSTSSQAAAPIIADLDPARSYGGAPVAQVSTEDRSASPPAQLSITGDRRRAPQLYQGGRTAAPAQPLSSPAEGRTGTVDPVNGTDRCDTARRRSNDSSRCENVIETRSAEFARRESAPLSPEARLLAEQRNRTLTGQESARRLANNSADPNDFQDQAIASVVLSQRGAPQREEEDEDGASLPTEAQAFQALIEGIVGNPPPP